MSNPQKNSLIAFAPHHPLALLLQAQIVGTLRRSGVVEGAIAVAVRRKVVHSVRGGSCWRRRRTVKLVA